MIWPLRPTWRSGLSLSCGEDRSVRRVSAAAHDRSPRRSPRRGASLAGTAAAVNVPTMGRWCSGSERRSALVFPRLVLPGTHSGAAGGHLVGPVAAGEQDEVLVQLEPDAVVAVDPSARRRNGRRRRTPGTLRGPAGRRTSASRPSPATSGASHAAASAWRAASPSRIPASYAASVWSLKTCSPSTSRICQAVTVSFIRGRARRTPRGPRPPPPAPAFPVGGEQLRCGLLSAPRQAERARRRPPRGRSATRRSSSGPASSATGKEHRRQRVRRCGSP